MPIRMMIITHFCIILMIFYKLSTKKKIQTVSKSWPSHFVSKQGLDLVKDGKLYGMSYQTCQGDAGLAVRTISEWFCGIDVNRVNYLRTDVVTSENTADFEPCQW